MKASIGRLALLTGALGAIGLVGLAAAPRAAHAQRTSQDAPRDSGGYEAPPSGAYRDQWDKCADLGWVLEPYLQGASYSFARRDYAKAAETALNGLRAAVKETGAAGDAQSAAAVASRRGVYLGETLVRELGNQPNGTHTLAHLLIEYVGFVVRVARDFDQPYFIPYEYQRHRRSSYDARPRRSSRDYDAGDGYYDDDYYDDHLGFEYAWLDFARSQLALALDALTFTASEGSRHRYDEIVDYPLGSPKAYFRSLQFFAFYASDDLARSLFAAPYRCAIRDLRRLSSFLAAPDAAGSAPVARYSLPLPAPASELTRPGAPGAPEPEAELPAGYGTRYRFDVSLSQARRILGRLDRIRDSLNHGHGRRPERGDGGCYELR